MEFSFDVNRLLREEVTVIDNNFQPCRQHGIDRFGFQHLQKMLYEIIDKMGDASAKAQCLPGSITTGKKLEHTNHHLYVMKDGDGNGGKGAVVGILKVGHKKLFVYDHCKAQHEMEPLCILDFYVHESRQRMGCGRTLFDFMLAHKSIQPDHLAIDRPSPKFLSFLAKHYKLETTIPQVNNFVIFEHFFNNRNNVRARGIGRGGSPGTYNGRASPMRPGSGQRGINQTHVYGGRQQQSPTAENRWLSPQARQSPSHMVAGDMMYSRHKSTPPLQGRVTPTQGPQLRNGAITPTRGLNSQQNLQHNQQQLYGQQQAPQPLNQRLNSVSSTNHNIPDSATFYKQLNSNTSPSTYYNTGTSPLKNGYPSNNILEHLPSNHPAVNPTNNNILPRVFPASTPNFGNRGATPGSTIPSPYPVQNGSGSGPKQLHNAQSGISSATLAPLSNGNANLDSHQSTQQQENVVAHRPPSGKQLLANNRRANPSQPPLLQRDGPSQNYKDMLNMHQTYQGRNGHMQVPDGKPPGVSPFIRPENQDNSWTVSGVLREQRLNAPLSNKYYTTTRLW